MYQKTNDVSQDDYISMLKAKLASLGNDETVEAPTYAQYAFAA